MPEATYSGLVTGISDLLEHARRMSVRSVNSILTATYWEIGRRIVEFEQGGKILRRVWGGGAAKPRERPYSEAWAWVLGAQSAADGGVLPGLADFPDAIWKIGGVCARNVARRGRVRFGRRCCRIAAGGGGSGSGDSLNSVERIRFRREGLAAGPGVSDVEPASPGRAQPTNNLNKIVGWALARLRAIPTG